MGKVSQNTIIVSVRVGGQCSVRYLRDKKWTHVGRTCISYAQDDWVPAPQPDSNLAQHRCLIGRPVQGTAVESDVKPRRDGHAASTHARVLAAYVEAGGSGIHDDIGMDGLPGVPPPRNLRSAPDGEHRDSGVARCR